MPEGGEDVSDPDGDTVRRFGVLQEPSSVAGGVGQEEVEEIDVRDSHCELD